MTEHVRDLMNSDMELDMGVMWCGRCDSTQNWPRLVSKVTQELQDVTSKFHYVPVPNGYVL